jgi:photosystem II oxygen-evolving enhancer protein 2
MDQPQKRSSRATTTLPDSAYGPPGRLNQKGVTQQGDTNVSVIVSSGLSGFTLKGTLGTPKDAAESLLLKSIAPEGSGRTATLLRSIEDRNGENYKFEYIVDFGERRPPLRNIAVIAASPNGETLYTLTVVAPAEKWMDDKYDAKLRKIADSFHLR